MSFEDWEAPEESSPERKLIFGVIYQAIQDACLFTNIKAKHMSKYIWAREEFIRNDARRWLTVKDEYNDDVRRFLQFLNLDEKKFYKNIKAHIAEFDKKYPIEIPNFVKS